MADFIPLLPDNIPVKNEETLPISSAVLEKREIPSSIKNLRSTAFGPAFLDSTTAAEIKSGQFARVGGDEYVGSSGIRYRSLSDSLPTIATKAYPPKTILRVYSDVYPDGRDFQVAGTGPADPKVLDFFTINKNEYSLMANQKISSVSVVDPDGLISETVITENTSTPNPDPQPSIERNIAIGGNGSARGMFSIPTAGAKVWVFFHGGDVQRPVYFASAVEPSNIYAAYQPQSDAPLLVDSETSHVAMEGLLAESGGITIVSNINGAEGIPYDASYLYTKGKEVSIEATNNFNLMTNGSHTLEAETVVQNSGSENIYIAGSSMNNVGSFTANVGNNTTAAVEASEKIQGEVNAIHKAQSDAIKNTTGTSIECPICAQKYLVDKGDFVKRIIAQISNLLNLLPWNCWNWPVTQFLLNMVVIPFLSEISGLAASGGKGCGACKEGQIESPKDKIDAGNEAASQELKKRQDVIDTASKEIKESPWVVKANGDVYLKAGLTRNNATAFNDTKIPLPITTGTEKSESSISYDTSKNSATVVEAAAVTRTIGNITLDSANDIKMVAGSPGFDIITQGNYKVSSGGVIISASDGPISIASKNVTTITGKTVLISDTDNGGIRLQSNNISMAGANHVGGDQYVRGTFTSDAVATKHLIIPSMRSDTTMSSSPKSVTNGATWYLEGATILDSWDKARNLYMRNLNPGWAITPTGITTLIEETYNSALLNIVFEPVPIGFAMTSYGIFPVLGFTHTHGMVPQDHSHQITLPKGNYYNDTESWHQARPETSHVPTPAPGQGDGSSPGPKSLGGCGGGGGGFGFGSPNSAASNNRKKRNSKVGLADGDYDYSRIVVGDAWSYDGDGNLIPSPTFGVESDC